MKLLVVLGSLIFALVCVCPSAHADTASEAQLQYELGAEMYKQGRYPEAIERFIASNRLVPNPNVVANIAKTFEFLKRPIDAYNWYVKFLEFDLSDEQQAAGEAALLQLEPKVAVLSVETDPPGALLFVDRPELGDVGRSPRRIAVAPGDRKILARLEQHEEAERGLSVEVGVVTPVKLELPPHEGRVEITTNPPGAQITSEEQSWGTTPTTKSLPVGTYMVHVDLDGYHPIQKKLVVTRDEVTQMALALRADLSKVALLSVRGNVEGAEVLYEERKLGLTPLSAIELAPGSGRIEVRAEGREPYVGSVVLEKGATTRLDVRLADPRDGPWLGYRYLGFGLGGGFLAAGAGVGLYSVNQRARFFDEPTRERYDRVGRMNMAADALFVTGAVLVVATTVWEIFKPARPRTTGKMEVDR